MTDQRKSGVESGVDEALYEGRRGAVARTIDRAIEVVAPGWALRRLEARAKWLFAYDAAKDYRTRRRFPEVPSSDDDLLPDLAKMRSNSRTLTRDDATAAGILRTLLEQCIGSGIMAQASVQAGEETGFTQAQADDWNGRATDLHMRWIEGGDCDPTGHADGYGMQRQGFAEFLRDGEFLLKRTTLKPGEFGRRFVSGYEHIDVDRLRDPTQTDNPLLRGGIELGAYGRPAAYWITPMHPSDSRTVRSNIGTGRNNEPVRWDSWEGGQPLILHGFDRTRSGQRRGVPMFASAYPLVEGVKDAINSEVVAMRAASKIVALITQTPNVLRALPPNLTKQDDGKWVEKLESGTMKRLRPGEDVKSFTPNRPGAQWDAMVLRCLRLVCSTFGLPYELVARDFGAMSFSGARVALQEAHRSFALYQSQFCRSYCQPQYQALITEAVVTGMLVMPPNWNTNRAAYFEAAWVPPSWGYVDPKTDAEASASAVASNVSTPQAEAAKNGFTLRTVLQQKAEALVLARELEEENDLKPGSLTETKPAATPPAPPSAEPDAAPGPTPPEPDPEDPPPADSTP